MLTLRSLAIAMAAAGVLAGLPARSAQACDNDRYPCPVVAQPQETDAPVRSPQLRRSRRPMPLRGKDEVSSRRATRRPGATKGPPQQPHGSFVPMPPPAPARKVQRVNRMYSVTMPRRPSRRVG
jgi:hypothetical protein